LRDHGAILVLEAHFYGPLAAMAHQPSHSAQQGWAAGDRFPVMRSIVEARIEVPPFID